MNKIFKKYQNKFGNIEYVEILVNKKAKQINIDIGVDNLSHGINCDKCNEFNEYAEPNQSNGLFKCYKCRNNY